MSPAVTKCLRKRPLTKTQAWQASVRLNNGKGAYRVEPYQCSFCGAWHIGRARKQ